MTQQTIHVIGAGLVGTLLAQQLAQQGHTVTVYEKLADPRETGFSGGRSINLALAERGLHALRVAGLDDAVRQRAVMVRGRMVHQRDGHAELHRYGVDDSEVNWSVSRAALNTVLLDAAEAAGVRFHFGQALRDADMERGRLRLLGADGIEREIDSAVTLGADGAGSALRAAMTRHTPLGERIEPLGHAYKELQIAALPDRQGAARFAIEPHALHIWPRGGYMAMALPNAEGSFTVTLFLPAQGAHPSFASLPDANSALAFFTEDFPDLLPLIADFAQDYEAHPVGSLATLYLDRWHIDGRALLIGDAAHAIVPFHGQGMNCGFEDTVLLARLLGEAAGDSHAAFAEFQRQRKPDTDAIAAMALENYVEMRDSVSDPHYLAKRELGALLATRAPEHFMPRYRMVTFTHLPYAYAYQRGRAQDHLLEDLLHEAGSLAAIDLDAATLRLRSALPPLPQLRD
ncbi:MAG: NAD(P)/FAD-dependent oxidoreductase [Dyella sp.]